MHSLLESNRESKLFPHSFLKHSIPNVIVKREILLYGAFAIGEDGLVQHLSVRVRVSLQVPYAIEGLRGIIDVEIYECLGIEYVEDLSRAVVYGDRPRHETVDHPLGDVSGDVCVLHQQHESEVLEHHLVEVIAPAAVHVVIDDYRRRPLAVGIRLAAGGARRVHDDGHDVEIPLAATQGVDRTDAGQHVRGHLSVRHVMRIDVQQEFLPRIPRPRRG